MAELISSYGIQVKHAGSSMKACCPFHHEKTPSFNINPNRGFYHCFGCGESGDAIKFVQKMDGLTFVEAAKKLADQCGIKIEEKEDPTAGKRKRLYTLMLELAQFYNRCLSHSSGKLAVEYLAKRNLGKEVQDDFLIGYAPEGVAPILKWAEKRQYTEEELDAIRLQYRHAQWFFDYVYVENSEGAHNSKLANSCLDKAAEKIEEGMKLFHAA